MSKKLGFTKIGLSILIAGILVFDLLLSPVLILLTDQNRYIASRPAYSYDELFSSNNKGFNSKDYIEFYSNAEDGVSAKKFLGTAQFERVSPYEYGIIMLLYRPEKRIGYLSLVTPLDNISEKFDEETINLSEETGFCSSGFLFFYRNRLYLLSHIKGNDYVKSENRSDIRNAIEFFQTSENKEICLFEVKNANSDFVNSFINEEYFSIKSYPEILRNLQLYFVDKLIAFAVFILQFVVYIIIL